MYLRAIAAEKASDARRDYTTLASMDEKAMRRAALVTLRRALCERCPPGSERPGWLRA